MLKKAPALSFVFVGSALAWGLVVAGCGSSSNSSDDSGGSSNGASSNGGSSNGGSSNGGSSNGGSSNGGSSSGSTGVGGATSGGSAGSGTGGSDWCDSGGCICSNGLDDDGDGLVDGFDPECTGPLDNDEGTFSTGIPGDNRDPTWQDCFFDGNSGAGDDHCRYHTDCLYGTLPADDPDCELSQTCIDFCQRLVPNGCDCFGCCTVTDADGNDLDVLTASSCSLANIDDETACPRCTKAVDCGNDCGECELCPGRTVEDLPDSCTPPPPDGGTYDGGVPPPPNSCDSGEIVCSEEIPCPGELYCSLGCCIEVVH